MSSGGAGGFRVSHESWSTENTYYRVHIGGVLRGSMEGTMSHIDVVGTGRCVRKLVGFIGLVLVFTTFWLAHVATDTWNAACPPGVTIGDVNHGAGGRECGKS